MSKIKCLECGTILESLTRHDYRECRCNNYAFIDGGDIYFRCGAMRPSRVAVWKDDKWVYATTGRKIEE